MIFSSNWHFTYIMISRDDIDDTGGAAEEEGEGPGTPGGGAAAASARNTDPDCSDADKVPFPSVTDINTRLRKLITGYQRKVKKEQQKLAQKAKVSSWISIQIRM